MIKNKSKRTAYKSNFSFYGSADEVKNKLLNNNIADNSNINTAGYTAESFQTNVVHQNEKDNNKEDKQNKYISYKEFNAKRKEYLNKNFVLSIDYYLTSNEMQLLINSINFSNMIETFLNNKNNSLKFANQYTNYKECIEMYNKKHKGNYMNVKYIDKHERQIYICRIQQISILYTIYNCIKNTKYFDLLMKLNDRTVIVGCIYLLQDQIYKYCQ